MPAPAACNHDVSLSTKANVGHAVSSMIYAAVHSRCNGPFHRGVPWPPPSIHQCIACNMCEIKHICFFINNMSIESIKRMEKGKGRNRLACACNWKESVASTWGFDISVRYFQFLWCCQYILTVNYVLDIVGKWGNRVLSNVNLAIVLVSWYRRLESRAYCIACKPITRALSS